MKKYTSEEVMVKPIDTKAIETFVREQLNDDSIETQYKVFKAALVENLPVLTDDECIYQILEKKMLNGKIGYYPEISIYKNKRTENGWTMPMSPAFDLVLNEEQLEKFLLPQITLKEFMAGRHEYNPRIKTNTKEMIENLSPYIEQSRATVE